jgi:uncharacterized protein (DUF2062 family)
VLTLTVELHQAPDFEGTLFVFFPYDGFEGALDQSLFGERKVVAAIMPTENFDLKQGEAGFCVGKLLAARDEFEVEIIVRAAWRGINVENVPIKVYYPPVEERVSHFRPFKDFTRISILNTVLVIYALLFYYPWRFFRQFSPENVRKFMAKHVIHSKESNVRMSCAIALGVFCSVIPVWGYQAILAAVIAQLLRLNKIVAAAFTGISIPPLIPVIIYVSMVLGAEALGIKNYVTLENISHQSALQSINQYIIGSVILGAILAVVGFIIAYFIMRKYRHSHE